MPQQDERPWWDKYLYHDPDYAPYVFEKNVRALLAEQERRTWNDAKTLLEIVFNLEEERIEEEGSKESDTDLYRVLQNCFHFIEKKLSSLMTKDK